MSKKDSLSLAMSERKPPRADPSIFGHIPGFPVGSTWKTRLECSNSGVHPGIIAGIYARKDDGARSVCLSGNYEDDEDRGDTFTYTGCGGREKFLPNGKKSKFGPQVIDQSFEDSPKNMGLKVSSITKTPVRVVRGFRLNSIYAPPEGYRYDGLYIIERTWKDKGKSGFVVCKFEFRRMPTQAAIPRLSYHLDLNRLKKSKRAPPSRTAKRRRTDTNQGISSDTVARAAPLTMVPILRRRSASMASTLTSLSSTTSGSSRLSLSGTSCTSPTAGPSSAAIPSDTESSIPLQPYSGSLEQERKRKLERAVFGSESSDAEDYF